jgi:hypothetical protein
MNRNDDKLGEAGKMKRNQIILQCARAHCTANNATMSSFAKGSRGVLILLARR